MNRIDKYENERLHRKVESYQAEVAAMAKRLDARATQLKVQRAQDAKVWREVADVLLDAGECFSLLIEERGDDAQQLDSTFQRTTEVYSRLRGLFEHAQLQTNPRPTADLARQAREEAERSAFAVRQDEIAKSLRTRQA